MKSHISKLFIGRILTFSILSLIILFWGLYNIFTKETSKDIFTMLIIFIIGSLVTISYCIAELFTYKTITISGNSIEIAWVIIARKKTIPLENISKIIRIKDEGLSSDAGKISDGYYYSELILKTGRSLIISPDHYEKYNEIIFEIKKEMEVKSKNSIY